MQKVGTFTHEYPEDGPPRTLYVCSVDNFEQLSEEVQPNSQYFGFFLAADARGIDDQRLRKVADALVEKGLACCCTWGPDCERVHDSIDHAAYKENELNEGTDDVIMTSWHASDSLRYTLWFFVECAFAARKYEGMCTDWIAASISNPDLDTVIRHKLAGKLRRNASFRD